MQDLINIFLEEAKELMLDLEDALLTLEDHPDDLDAVNRVFRVMHTLKGSGAMFGYEVVSDFTHNLESVYDLIRNQKLALSKDILTVTLHSLDHIKAIFEHKGTLTKELAEQHNNLKNTIQGILNKDNVTAENPVIVSNSEEHYITYHIHFKPDEDVFLNGTNPLYLIDELCSFGSYACFINTSNIPEYNNFECKKCYTSWDVYLSCEQSLDDLLDIFIFLDEKSEVLIHVLNHGNILNSDKVKQEIEKLYERNPADIKPYIENITIDTDSASENKAEEDNELGSQTIENIPQNNLEVQAPILKMETQASPIPTQQTNQNKPLKASSIRVSSDKIQELMNLVSELVTNQSALELLSRKEASPLIREHIEKNDKLIRRLRDNTLEISLIPISNLLTRFKRLVRDLSNELDKDVEFISIGEETEIDKAIIDQLSDPLMHIFRNAMDHGIESKEARNNSGKNPKGKIEFIAYYSGSNVILEINDDGKGIDAEIIKNSAIKKGLITASTELSEEEIINLIFEPGFSTAEKVSDLSGRGVGMDVVKRKIKDLRGSISIQSKVGKGSKFIIKLPLTLSIMDGLLLRIDHTPYIINMLSIEKIYEVAQEKIDQSFNHLLDIDGKQYPFMDLRDTFNQKSQKPIKRIVLLLSFEKTKFGIIVDKIEGEIQVVVNPISGPFAQKDIIAGGAILGEGNVALVLDTNRIIEKYT